MRKFFVLEKSQAGWRFWLFWVVMTNFGFFSGLAVSGVVGRWLTPDWGEIAIKSGQGIVSALLIGGLTGLAQGFVLQRHGVSGSAWTLATSLGWAVGVLIAGLLIFNLDPDIPTSDFWRWIVPAGFIAGAVVGLPQWWVLKRRFAELGLTWVLVSAVGWGIQFPGMVPGVALARLLREHDESMGPPPPGL